MRHEEFTMDTDEVTDIEHLIDKSVVERFSGGSLFTLVSGIEPFAFSYLCRLMFKHDLYLPRFIHDLRKAELP